MGRIKTQAKALAITYDTYTQNNINLLNHRGHYDPHRFLGVHPNQNGGYVVRLWRPGAENMTIQTADGPLEMVKMDPSGLFECTFSALPQYRIEHSNGLPAEDPYAFLPTFGETDQYLFARGLHYKLYEKMGAIPLVHQGVPGVAFTVWAPNAKQVSLVGDFNHWDGRTHPMRSLGYSGVWELFVPRITAGHKYKFEIVTQKAERLIKADPYARYSERRPSTASIVADVESFLWSDEAWMQQRHQAKNGPMAVYEVHLGSWKRDDNNFYSYRQLAHELADYCLEMKFTHVELLPISEHPLDESWGYQVTGFYAVTSRFGKPEDFQYFVNHLHSKGIGVLLDWVPAHFPTDAFSLGRFDGEALYEHEDPRQGFHPHWSTYLFNYGRHEVSNFLIANVLYWAERFHLDGFRVDAVASMLYLDYGRNAGEWIPNRYGGKENLEAIEFIKHLNSVVHQFYPSVIMIAEESTAFPSVTKPVEKGGLGFDFKWNMGWMSDTLTYFCKDPIYRRFHHHHLSFGLLYAFTERFISVLSHDEVVHGKGSLIAKMPGDWWQKFAGVRLLYSYMICQPGKKLLFMGGGNWPVGRVVVQTADSLAFAAVPYARFFAKNGQRGEWIVSDASCFVGEGRRVHLL